MKDQQLSVVAEKSSTNVTVLRIATAARNSVTQLYSNRPQVFLKQIEELDKKIVRKLALHHIFEVTTSVCLQFENDRVVSHCACSWRIALRLLQSSWYLSSLVDHYKPDFAVGIPAAMLMPRPNTKATQKGLVL